MRHLTGMKTTRPETSWYFLQVESIEISIVFNFAAWHFVSQAPSHGVTSTPLCSVFERQRQYCHLALTSNHFQLLATSDHTSYFPHSRLREGSGDRVRKGKKGAASIYVTGYHEVLFGAIFKEVKKLKVDVSSKYCKFSLCYFRDSELQRFS